MTATWLTSRAFRAKAALCVYSTMSLAALAGIGTCALAEKVAPGEARAPMLAGSSDDPLPPRALARLGTLRFRQREVFTSISYSPDGLTLASGGYMGALRFWDTLTGKERSFVLPNYLAVYQLVAYAPKGKMLVATGSGHTFIWRTQGDKDPQQIEFGMDRTWSLAVSPMAS
jgi:WD40 repeat protein